MSKFPIPHLSRRRFCSGLLAGSAAASLSPYGAAESLLKGRRKLGVALIGLGGYATGQLGPALRETHLCALRGVVTGDRAKGLRWARDYGFPEGSVYHYDHMDRIADNPDIDIVYSVTPPLMHHRDVLAGAAAGKHVICEKPMTVDVPGCEEMVVACRKAGVKLSMGYRLHFHPYYRRVKEIAAKSLWGGPTEMSGGFGSPHAQSGWRTDVRLAGGGQLMNIGIYVINSALMAMGEIMPVKVSAQERPKTQPKRFADMEETLDFLLEFPDGSRCEGTTSGIISSNNFRSRGPGKSVEMEPAFPYRGLRMREDGELTAPLVDFNQQAHQMDAFAAHILEGSPNIVSGEMGLRDMQIISAIYESARTGDPIRFS